MTLTLYVPKVGDKIELVEPWTFTLHYERRNSNFFYEIVPKKEQKQDDTSTWRCSYAPVSIALLSGTVLKIDRVYVRKGTSSGYDSLTFYIVEHHDKKYVGKRFWAKLDDCNQIRFKHYIDPPKPEKKKVPRITERINREIVYALGHKLGALAQAGTASEFHRRMCNSLEHCNSPKIKRSAAYRHVCAGNYSWITIHDLEKNGRLKFNKEKTRIICNFTLVANYTDCSQQNWMRYRQKFADFKFEYDPATYEIHKFEWNTRQ